MVNSRPNQKADIIQELKYFSHCKIKSIEPGHTCTIRELCENLKMTPNLLIKNLREMVSDGILKKDKIQSPKFKARKRDVYTVIDRRMFESKDLVRELNYLIDSHTSRMRLIGKKMRDRPAMKSVEMIRLPSALIHNSYSRSYQGKIDKKGQEYLEHFCELVNSTFSILDSMTYAMYDHSIDSDEKTEREIKALRIHTLNEITDVLEYVFKPYSARLQNAIQHSLIMRIPTYFMIGQLKKRSKLTI